MHTTPPKSRAYGRLLKEPEIWLAIALLVIATLVGIGLVHSLMQTPPALTD